MTKKRVVQNLFFAFLLLIASGVALSHENHDEKQNAKEDDIKKLEVINQDYLKTVKPIFARSCMDCHSGNTHFPWYSSLPGAKQLIESDISEARKHLDMSNDFPFKSHATPKEDLAEIAKVTRDRSMPPLRYRILHSTASLSDADIKTIQSWVDSAIEKLK